MLGGIFDKNKVKDKIRTFDNKITEENFWKDKSKVKKTVKEKKIYEDILNSFKSSTNEIKNLRDLYNLALDENNDEILKDCDMLFLSRTLHNRFKVLVF